MNIQKAYDGICIRSSGRPMYDPLTHNTRLTSLAENFMTESPEQPCALWLGYFVVCQIGQHCCSA